MITVVAVAVVTVTQGLLVRTLTMNWSPLAEGTGDTNFPR